MAGAGGSTRVGSGRNKEKLLNNAYYYSMQMFLPFIGRVPTT